MEKWKNTFSVNNDYCVVFIIILYYVAAINFILETLVVVKFDTNKIIFQK